MCKNNAWAAGTCRTTTPLPPSITLSRPPPISHAKTLCVQNVLAPILQPEEVELIFGAVTRAYSDSLPDALEQLLGKGSAWEPVVATNVYGLMEVCEAVC